MIDLNLLIERGIDVDGLRKKLERLPKSLTLKNRDGDEGKRVALLERIKARVTAGRDFNFGHYSLYYALDLAYDSSFTQITPTLLNSLTDKGADDASVLNAVKDWSLNASEIFVEVPDPKTPGKNIRKVSVPAIFKVVVPLVPAYVKIRWAKLVNDLRLVPFFKYEPAITNSTTRMRCETITARVETMARQYGYFDILKQAIFRMLHYAECFKFPVEEWHQECQEYSADSKIKGDDVKDSKGKVVGKKVVVKEGLRHHLPHPTRTYYDRAWLPSTFNSDTGCSFGGYFRVMRWGDVRSNKSFYNMESIGYSSFSDIYNKSKGYFENVFRGCVINMPSCYSSGGVSRFDNERHIADNFYNTNDDDKSVIITEHFEKLVPSEWGLGDYDYPVWFRFVLAGDDVVMYAAPIPYSPVIYYGYDSAEGRTHTASMSLEILPFQDQFTNLLSQYLLTVRQNLMNLTMIDTDVVNEADIKTLENWGEKLFRSLNFLRFSGKKLEKRGGAGRNDTQVLFPQQLRMMDTNGLMLAMKTILDTLERILVMSSQEVGQAASHEQTAEEVKNVAVNTSTRVVFTATAIGVAREAEKRQIYQALMAYGADEMYVQVPMEEPMTESDLEKMGFSYANGKDDPAKSFDAKEKKAFLKVPKTAIAYESFASSRDGDDRVHDAESARAMIDFMTGLLSNPMIGPKIGAEQAIKAANLIGRMAGFPREFKFTPLTNPEQDQNVMLEQLQQHIEQVKAGIENDVKQGFVAVMDENKSQSEQIAELQQGLKELLFTSQQAPPVPSPMALDQFPPSVPNAPIQMPMPMPQAAY